jgi:hypothetical protein
VKPEFFHQNQLAPEDNKFHVGNGEDGKHYWLTPPALLAQLSAEFGPFDFDPCPYPKPDDFDGLTCEWGQRSYVNPPFGSIMHMGKKKGPTAWVRKAIEEWQKGKLVVLVYPVDKWLLMLLKAILGEHGEVRNLGDVKWLATEDGSTGKGTGRHIACFVLRPLSLVELFRREAGIPADVSGVSGTRDQTFSLHPPMDETK